MISAGTASTTRDDGANGQRVAMRSGSTIALTSAGGTQAVQLFAPYGPVRSSQGNMPTTYNFTWQRLDSETGLLYYNFRYYDPLSGRFVRADTTQTNAGGMDPYAYVGDNPETKNDPTEHDGWNWGLIIAVVAIVVVVAVVAVVAAPVLIAAAATAGEVAATAAAADGAAVAGAAAAEATTAAVADTAATVTAETAATAATETATTAAETTTTASAETASAETAAGETATGDAPEGSGQEPVRLYRSGRSPQGGNNPALNNLRPGQEYTPNDPANPQGDGTVNPNSDQGISAYTKRVSTWRHTYAINSDQAPEGYYWRQDPQDPTHFTLNPEVVTSKQDYIDQVDTLWYRELWEYLTRLP